MKTILQIRKEVEAEIEKLKMLIHINITAITSGFGTKVDASLNIIKTYSEITGLERALCLLCNNPRKKHEKHLASKKRNRG